MAETASTLARFRFGLLRNHDGNGGLERLTTSCLLTYALFDGTAVMLWDRQISSGLLRFRCVVAAASVFRAVVVVPW